MSTLNITKTYEDGITPTQADFDNICDSLETFLNTTKLGSDNIANASVTASSTIAPGTITAGKIAGSAVTTVKILDSAVTTAKIEASAITAAKIAASNVTTAKIADEAVTNAKVVDGAVTADKKPNNSTASGGATWISTASAATSSSAATATLCERPTIIVNAGDLDFNLATPSTLGQVQFSGRVVLYRGGSIVQNNEIVMGGANAITSGQSGTVTLPASCVKSLYLNFSDSESRAYKSGGTNLTGTGYGSSTLTGTITTVIGELI